jgi:hypothetical protein
MTEKQEDFCKMDSLLDIMPSNGGRLPPDGTRVSFPETSAA